MGRSDLACSELWPPYSNAAYEIRYHIFFLYIEAVSIFPFLCLAVMLVMKCDE